MLKGVLLFLSAIFFGSFVAAKAGAQLGQLTAGQYTIDSKFFGMHFHRLVLRKGEKAIETRWPDSAVGALRLWDSTTLWMNIAPKAGIWDFSRMDRYVDEAANRGVPVLYTFGGTPRWLSARPDEKCPYGMGCSAEPVRLAHWEEYVRRVAERYKGKVTDYELWNEPKFMDFERDRKQYAAGGVFFYTGNIASMVEMAKAARRVLDQVDPEARLFTPGFVNGTDRLDAFLAQGGAQYVQGVAYHFYDFSSVDSLFFLKEALEVKAIMRKHGLAGLPLWNTETGVETDFGEGIPGRAGEGHSEETATWKMGQLMILAAFSGVDRYFYYAWDNDKSGMVMRDGALRPRHAAYGRLKNWLSGITTQSCSAKGGVVMCSARKAEREFMFVWADKLVDGDIDVPSGRRLTSVESTSGAPLAYSYVRGGVVRLSVSRDPIRLAFE